MAPRIDKVVACGLTALLAALPARGVQAAALQLRGDSSVALGTAFAGAGSAADTPASTFSNPAGLTQFAPYGYITRQINDRLSVGLAITSPFGLATTYGMNFVDRYQADKTDLAVVAGHYSNSIDVASLGLRAAF